MLFCCVVVVWCCVLCGVLLRAVFLRYTWKLYSMPFASTQPTGEELLVIQLRHGRNIPNTDNIYYRSRFGNSLPGARETEAGVCSECCVAAGVDNSKQGGERKEKSG